MAKRLFKVLDKPATWIEVDVDATQEQLAEIKAKYVSKLTLKGLKDSGYFDNERLRSGGKTNAKLVAMDEINVRDCLNNVGYKW